MKASKFNQGFATVEYLSAALVDMKLHLAATPDSKIDPDAFEKKALAELGMPSEIVDAAPNAAVRTSVLERRLFGRLL
jgi:peptidyl-dipeptidase Dcp